MPAAFCVQVLVLVPRADVAARALCPHMPCIPLPRRRADETLTFVLLMVTKLCAGAGAGAARWRGGACAVCALAGGLLQRQQVVETHFQL
jgi:hypothetical protein